MQKIAIFVDVQNIYYTTRSTFQSNFDYNQFWKKVTSNKEVVVAFAYAVERGDEKQRQFQNILRAIGFEVKLKPFIQRADGSAKGDWDVGITMDMMEYADQVDSMVLASGDGDFDILVKRLVSKNGLRVDVFGVEALTANSLINATTDFTPIEGDLLLG